MLLRMAKDHPRRGRPPKDPRERRGKVVAVRFTADEWKDVQRAMEFASTRARAKRPAAIVTPSEVIRRALGIYLLHLRSLRSQSRGRV